MREALLMLAGGIASVLSIVHGVLMQRFVVAPVAARIGNAPPLPRQVRDFLAPLLHFTTFGWLLGGVVLLVAPQMLPRASVTWLAVFAGALFLYGAIANFAATRGRHPGWVGMATSIGLILYALLVAS